jgi:hypothetical protein
MKKQAPMPGNLEPMLRIEVDEILQKTTKNYKMLKKCCKQNLAVRPEPALHGPLERGAALGRKSAMRARP